MPSGNANKRERLEYLLQHRKQLKNDEWEELSRLVSDELLSHPFTQYQSLPLIKGQPEDPRLLIESFFDIKLKRPVNAKTHQDKVIRIFELHEQYKKFLVNDGVLNVLWRHRNDPNPPEIEKEFWDKLYRQVYRILSPYSFSYYQALSMRFSQTEKNLKAHLISRFFADKILLPTKSKKTKSQHITKSYLYRMYENWLVDMVRQPLPQDPDITSTQTVENGDSTNNPPLDIFNIFGITQECVLGQAMSFLEAMGHWEFLKKKNTINWIRIFLIEHHCAPDPIPMSQLAREHQIPAYHHKAQKLGITSARGGFPNMSDFEASNLGQWVISLLEECTSPDSASKKRHSLSRSDEDRKFITKALDFMCLAALKYKRELSVHG
ncbi:MAG: hypothetical protein QNJ78_09275 [Gammaproteobacteria bacterium]|nr:hypothetical protein [Gammaproteobacteria bacterium]